LKNKGRVGGGFICGAYMTSFVSPVSAKLTANDQTCKEQKCWGLKYNKVKVGTNVESSHICRDLKHI